MRRRAAALAAALAMLAASVPGLAQEVRVGGGAALPLEPSGFTDLYDFGLHFGAELTAPVNKRKTTHLGLAAYHHRFLLDESGALDAANAPSSGIELSGGTFYVTEVMGWLRADLASGGTRPFLVLGAGVAHHGTTDLETTVAGQTRVASFDTEIDTMLSGGLGVSHDLGAVALFGQVRIAYVFTDDDSTAYVPLTVGAAF